MKTFLLSLFLFAPLCVAAQTVDSTAIRQADSLLRVARNLRDSKEFDKALKIADAAEKLALSPELGMGPESAAYGSCCNIRGLVFQDQYNYAESEKWHLKALSVREKAFGKESTDYCGSLINLATLYARMDQSEKAEALFLEARDIFVHRLNDRTHPFYINCLINLATLYGKVWQYEKAEPLFLEARDYFEVRLNNRTQMAYLHCSNNLALLYFLMGNYEKSEELQLEAISMKEKVLGKGHPDCATSLSNLAKLYCRMEQYEKSEQLYLEAISIQEKALGKEHPDYASSLKGLANLYYQMDNCKKAEPLFLEALSIYEKIFGKGRDVINTLNGLANLYAKMRNYEKSEQLQLEAISIAENTLGKENLQYAFLLEDLGWVYLHTDRYEEAERALLEAAGIMEKVLGKEHPDNAFTLTDLAHLYWKTGKYGQTSQILTELVTLNRSLLIKAMRHLSERELNSYLNKFSDSQNLTWSLIQQTGVKDLAPICYDNTLFYKGFLLNSATRLNALAESSPAAQELNNQLKGYQRRLAAQYAMLIAERQGVAELEEKANAAEKELARTVAGYAEAAQQVRWNEVQAALKPDEAAVEFVRFNFTNPDPTDNMLYAALVLRPGFTAPQYISLFEEKTLAALLQQDNEKQAEHINALYRNPALYALLWQPLEKALAGVKTVWFSSDGLLHRLNIRAIATPDAHILSERYRLIRLNSTRQLVIPPSTKPAANDALVYGGIQYDMDAGAIQKANASFRQDSLSGTRGVPDFHSTDSTLRLGYRGPGEGGAWNYLPFTEVEAGLLQHDLQEAGTSVRVLSGYAATEESFKALGHPSPRTLHLATHGFFFPDPKKTADGRRLTVDGEEPVFKLSDHPMIRSGLLLAGANYAWKSGQPAQPGMEDGILTAYEISQMDLSNTELAVLSACETGLGDIAGNEGVYGLQRAFKIAGTRYLFMSLWKIPDLETQQLMTTFYRHWLKDGKSVPDAYQATQQEMREKYKDPYLWAGFVLVE